MQVSNGTRPGDRRSILESPSVLCWHVISVVNVHVIWKILVIHSKPKRSSSVSSSFIHIYTPSVFCYDKHKKNFDIQFSMKRHETV